MYHNSLSNTVSHQRPRRHAACHTQQPNLGHLSTPRHLRQPQCRSASNGGFDSAYDRLEAISISLKAFPEVEFFQITAILRPWRLNGVIKALNSQGIRGLTVSDVAGIGFQGGKERYGGTEFGGSDLIEKKKLDIVCERTQVDDICRCIAVAAYTGELGDGKIFCYPVADIGLELKRHVDVTLGRGNIYEAVKLPPGEDVREWLAVNTVDMYNAISVLYLTLVDFCSDSSCPTMSAGPKYEYLWADGVKVKKPMKVTAPQYVNALFDWIEEQIDDSNIFPSEVGSTFPGSFKEVVKKIFKRLFRVYAHIYHSHFHEICSLKAEAHLNTCFKHFILFTKHYDLVDEKEMAPLQELIEKQTGGVIP